MLRGTLDLWHKKLHPFQSDLALGLVCFYLSIYFILFYFHLSTLEMVLDLLLLLPLVAKVNIASRHDTV